MSSLYRGEYGDSNNRFEAFKSNPVNRRDPQGLQCEPDTGFKERNLGFGWNLPEEYEREKLALAIATREFEGYQAAGMSPGWAAWSMARYKLPVLGIDMHFREMWNGQSESGFDYGAEIGWGHRTLAGVSVAGDVLIVAPPIIRGASVFTADLRAAMMATRGTGLAVEEEAALAQSLRAAALDAVAPMESIPPPMKWATGYPSEQAQAPVRGATTEIPRFTFRGDTRAPAQIFESGFRPRGTSIDLLDYTAHNTPSNFVGTSMSPRIASGFAGEGGYVYTLRPGSGAINVNSALGKASLFPFQAEVVVPGGVNTIDIMGGRAVGPNGLFTGPFIRNPYFNP